MNKQQTISAIEAVLFASGDPISIDRLSQTFEIKPEEVEKYVKELEKKYDTQGSGFYVVRLENTYQLVTREDFAQYIKTAFDIKRRTPLSPAALEVLAVIAYNQPVTRSFIEQVRGVDCSGVVSTLIEKGLIEERGRLELPGRPLLYGTTKTFLRSFSLNDLSDLPPLPKDNPEVNDIGEQLEISEDITPEEVSE
ncbi:MAG: SMC-Scp complex subunit ScpB [Ruminococcaceae bacterium]|nr:SMC-Scp complex subunit ScpB [Oscillospiraceae bacterium]